MDILKGKVAVVTGSTSGIGLAYARAFAGAGANIVLNGIRGAGRCRKNADCNRERFRGEGDLFAREYGRANGNRQHDLVCREDVWQRGRARQQCRHPACLANRGFSGRKVGRSHRNQPLLRIPCDPCRYSWHEATRLGPYHHHGVGAFAGRVALQVGLRRGQARHRGTHQDGGAGTRPVEDHLQLHQPRLRLDAAGGEADPEHDEGAQHERGIR